MNRFVIPAAVAAFATLGAVAANAADLRGDALQNSGATALRAGNVYTAQELTTVGLQASDLIEVAARDRVQVRAGEVYTAGELKVIGLNANDLLNASDFSGNGAVEQYDTIR